MVVEHGILPYFQWLFVGSENSFGALWQFLAVAFGLGLIGTLIGFALATGRHGILRGGDVVYRTLAGGVKELRDTSLRRVGALARLAMKEAWRRRVIAALAVFFLILLFASWFLKTNYQEPGRLFISFVLTASTYLVLLVALVLSAFSLPTDFKSKTIYTVVTKPVRAGEILLGRIVGFAAVGTLLLAIMGVGSYVFVVRSLHHGHRVATDSAERVVNARGEVVGYVGNTSSDGEHFHALELNAEGSGEAIHKNGHDHQVTRNENGYVVGPPRGFLQARVPHYGKLSFVDRQGNPSDKGISVGNEWAYRSFIEGNGLAAATWKFSEVSATSLSKDDKDREVLPLSLFVRVFRTHKGVIGQAIAGTIQIRNPENAALASEPIPFSARDQTVDELEIPRTLTLAARDQKDRRPIDLIDDLTTDAGEVEVVVQCLERGQYFGFAQADCYVRRPDGSPVLNLLKVYMSIWVQMVIVIALGVAVSTLVNGPVALLFIFVFVFLGFYRQDFLDVATGNVYGGGPAESLIRMATQANVMIELDPTIGVQLAKGFDRFAAQPAMWAVAQTLPDFSAFSTVNYAADGYMAPWPRVAEDLTVCLGYVAALVVLGFFLLRTREVAK